LEEIMNARPTTADENKLALEIISVLPAESVARLVSEDSDTIRFSVAGMKLRTIVLNRQSLRKLCSDPAREVKVEYLQRDLVRSAGRRAEFRYPRLSRIKLTVRRLQRLAMATR
jgi:hypothetical protein